MKGFLAVTRRELRERRNLVLAAPILALVPLLAPYMPGLNHVPPGEVRLNFTVGLAFVLPLALALGLGASALGSEVAGRRLGFFFSRPLSTFEIWSGKIVVALVVPIAVSVLALGPVILWTRPPGSEMPWHGFDSGPLFAILGLSWVLASLAHVAAGLYQTRSPLLVLDLALAGAVSGALYTLGWHVIDAGLGLQPRDFGPDSVPLWIAILLFVGICLAAGYAQVAVGRSDPRRGHRALSLTLWGGLGLALAATAAASAWLLNPAPQDLQYRTVVPLPGGYFLLGGVGSRGVFSTLFLVDPRDGRAQRISSGTSGLVPSSSGRHVLFGEGMLSPRLVVVSAVSGQPPVITRALLAKEDEAWPVCLSDDGLLAVIRERSESRVVETATGKRLGLPALEAAAACTFEGRRRLVLYRADLVRLSLYRRIVDLETGAQGESVEYPGGQGIFEAHGDRVLVRMGPAGSRTEIVLFDGASGRALANLGPAAWGPEGDPASFLPDGRVAFVGGGQRQDTLRLFDADGHERLAVRVADKGKAALAGVTPEDEISVVVWSDETFHTVILDGQTLAPKRRIEGLRPALGPLTFANFDPAARIVQSQERLRQGLFVDAKGAIVHLDPTTGATKVLVAASPGPSSTP